MKDRTFQMPRGDTAPEPYGLYAQRIMTMCGAPWSFKVEWYGGDSRNAVPGWQTIYGFDDEPALPFMINMQETDAPRMALLIVLAFLGEWRGTISGPNTYIAMPYDSEIVFRSKKEKIVFEEMYFDL